MNFDGYDPENGPFYDETFAVKGQPRPGFEPLVAGIHGLDSGVLASRQAAAERALLSMGITFTLMGENGGAERIFPFDIIPRIVSGKEWSRLEAGLRQRIEALNLFICDVYGDQKILRDKVVSEDLVVRDGFVQMRTTAGLARVDVIYRRVSDDYLDPLVFRPDSVLGIPGVIQAYLQGRVALANAPGTGVADDKAIYRYAEKIIKYYLDQDAIIPNVPTYVCAEDEDRSYVLDHLSELVVKATDGAGGYWMLICSHSTHAERVDFAQSIRKY